MFLTVLGCCRSGVAVGDRALRKSSRTLRLGTAALQERHASSSEVSLLRYTGHRVATQLLRQESITDCFGCGFRRVCTLT